LLPRPSLIHRVQLLRRPKREKLTAAEEADPFVNRAKVGEMIGKDEAPARVERHFGERPQLNRAQLAIEFLAELDRVVFLAVDLRFEALGARKPEAHQAAPAVVLGQTESAGVLVSRGDGVAERGRQDVATFVRSEEHTSELQSREKLVCRL